MGTTEIIIVFGALMVLIALVTIGIDWIGKPLKHRRFIARIYRFENEKLPLDRYGNPTFDPEPDSIGPAPHHVQVPLLPVSPPQPHPLPVQHPPTPQPTPQPTFQEQPPPVVVARVDTGSTDPDTSGTGDQEVSVSAELQDETPIGEQTIDASHDLLAPVRSDKGSTEDAVAATTAPGGFSAAAASTAGAFSGNLASTR